MSQRIGSTGRAVSRRAAILWGAAVVLGRMARGEARPGGGDSFRSTSDTSESSSRSSSPSRSSDGWSSGGPSASSSGDSSATIEALSSAILGGLVGALGYWGAGLSLPLRRSFAAGAPPRTLRTWLRATLGVLVLFVAGTLVVLSPDWIARGVGGLVLALALLRLYAEPPAARGGAEVATPPAASQPPPASVRQGLEVIRARDPGFSRVALLDFVQALVTRSYTLVGQRQASLIRPFVSDEAVEALARHATSPVDGIVIGSMSLQTVRPDVAAPDGSTRDEITVDIEANYTLRPPGADPVRTVVREHWILGRATAARSLAPARMRVLSCPACGAPAAEVEAAACRYCRQTFVPGQDQWLLIDVWRTHGETFSTDGLGESVPERGTERPTVFDPDLAGEQAAFAAAHGQPGFAALEAAFFRDTVTPTFLRMYAAWASRRWTDVRHLLGDRLWESQLFWIRAYDERGLTNRLDDVAISRIETVRIERDVHFEAMTVRIAAACLDYTVDATGRVVGGSAQRPRRFSEYWTFVRSVAAADRPARHAEAACPACGAPLDRIGEAGVCGYCEAKVTTGDFGWVLTVVTQDEVYRPES